MPDLTEWKVKQDEWETEGPCGVLGNLRISPERLWLSERYEIKALITGMLIACRKSLTLRSGRSESPIGRALKQPSALSGSLERTSHSAALPFVHKTVLSSAEKIPDLFAGSLGKASGFAYENDLKALSKVIGLDDFEGAREN